MRYIFDFDSSRCVNCGACTIACMDQNDIYPQEGDKPFRVTTMVENGHGKSVKMTYLSIGCMHCSNAPCVQGCPSGVLYKDKETGLTLYDNSNCIGCHSCAMACPFGAPTFNNEGVMEKCDGCVERLKAGLQPACVMVCPFDAIKVYTDEEYEKIKRKNAAKRMS